MYAFVYMGIHMAGTQHRKMMPPGKDGLQRVVDQVIGRAIEQNPSVPGYFVRVMEGILGMASHSVFVKCLIDMCLVEYTDDVYCRYNWVWC